MGLDISLVRIIDKEVDKFCYLIASESPELLPLFSHLIRIKRFKFYDGECDAEVFFYEELAHQRRRVIEEFYQDLENDKCLTNRTEVEKLWHYVSEEQQQNFKEQFVDRFVNGETVVTISW